MISSDTFILKALDRIYRKLESICCNTATGGSLVIDAYQVTNCDGDPVGSPISVMPTITVNSQDVNVCNVTEVADAIRGLYNVPVVETASADWNASDNNDITKIHSINITVIGTLGVDTVDLTIDAGTPVTLPVGNNIYAVTASTTFGVDFSLTSFVGAALAVISIVKEA